MRDTIIQLIEESLLKRKDFFMKEEEIQLYLANCLSESKKFDLIHLEYHIPFYLLGQYPWSDSKNVYIDVVIEKNNKYYPIEVKYKTTSQKLPINVFGSSNFVNLEHHGAQNIGCYDFWKDIKRLEFFENNFKNVESGIMLFITNDNSYLKSPQNKDVGYAQFSIEENRSVKSGEVLDWNGALSISVNRPPIVLNHSYTLNWKNLNLDQHKYLII
jgi:hypothetical protein